jgi:hypothetical protein
VLALALAPGAMQSTSHVACRTWLLVLVLRCLLVVGAWVLAAWRLALFGFWLLALALFGCWGWGVVLLGSWGAWCMVHLFVSFQPPVACRVCVCAHCFMFHVVRPPTPHPPPPSPGVLVLRAPAPVRWWWLVAACGVGAAAVAALWLRLRGCGCVAAAAWLRLRSCLGLNALLEVAVASGNHAAGPG